MYYSKTISLAVLLASATFTSAFPRKRLPGGLGARVVDQLNEEATAEAHQRDNTATRAFSSISITNGDGDCLFVDPLSGDFRANLLPVQSRACDGADDQKWDIITAGLHNDQPGTMLVVSALTQGCLNYDPRRQPGDQVNIFSCGGRAAGEGVVTNSQLFSFPVVSAGPLALQPLNEAGTCVTIGATRLDKAACNAADQSQSFTFGDGGDAPPADDTEDPVSEAPTATESSESVITDAPEATQTSVDGGVIGTEDGFTTIPFPGSTDIAIITTTAAAGNLTTTALLPTSTSINTIVEVTSVIVDPSSTAVGAPAPTGNDGPGGRRGRGRGRGRGGRGRGRNGRNGRNGPARAGINSTGNGDRDGRKPCPDKDN